jgi:hypothetical protein
MFADAARRKFEGLLVWSLDRFSREGLAAKGLRLVATSKVRSSPRNFFVV